MRVLPVIDRGERVLVAVSGGADSTALLLCLAEQAREGAFSLVCGHVQHGIRETAGRDACFVQSLCARLGVPLRLRSVDAPGYARHCGVGLETAARVLRRQALLEMADESGAAVIATAHHADDQAETVLMHLLRGGGLHGATGMRPRDGRFVRPLLQTDRADILAYLAGRGEPHCEDETNAVADNPRNALRLLAMPALERIYPGASRNLGRFAEIARADDALLSDLTDAFLRDNAQALPLGYRVRVADAPVAVWRRALHRLTRQPFEGVERLRTLLSAPRAKATLPGFQAERSGVYLYLTRLPVALCPPVPLQDGARLLGHRFRVANCAPEPERRNRFEQVFDADALTGACLRARQPGDRFRPLGAGYDKKLSDELTDRKFDRPLRDQWPLVARGARILWIPGVAVAQDAAISDQTRRALRVDCIKEDDPNGS